MPLTIPAPSIQGKYVIHYSDFDGDKRVGVPRTVEVDVVVGADGANSRVAKVSAVISTTCLWPCALPALASRGI